MSGLHMEVIPFLLSRMTSVTLSLYPYLSEAKAGEKSLVKAILKTLAYHLHTIYLFMKGDIGTVLLPWTIFGIGHALSAPLLGLKDSISILDILARLPLAALWILVNVLPVQIEGQIRPHSIEEDRINKAWRPICAGRITPEQAKNLMWATYASALAIGYHIGGNKQVVELAFLNFLYNKMGGSEKSWISRQLLNGLAFVTIGIGATEVALGSAVNLQHLPVMRQWLCIVVLVVFTGIQSQDFYDIKGDSLIGRRTLPIVAGDAFARWGMVVSMISCSVLCPLYWDLGLMGYVVPILFAIYISSRYVRNRIDKEFKADKMNYKLWNLWLLVIYCLPLFKTLEL